MAEPDFIPLPTPKKEKEADFIPLNAGDDRGVLANTPEDGTISSALKAAGTAAIKGASALPGSLGDIRDLVGYLYARALSPSSHEEAVERMASIQDYWKQQGEKGGGLGAAVRAFQALPTGADVAAPILKETGEYVPQSDVGRYLMTAGEGATAMLGPAGFAGAVRSASRGLAPAAGAARSAVRAAPAGAGAATAGTLATDVTGDPLAGMTAATVMPLAARVALAPVKDYGATVIAPYASRIAQQVADEKLLKATKDPAAAIVRAQEAEKVAGSQPTLAEVTGDQGLMRAQRAVESADISDAAARLKMQQAQQNAARRDVIESLAPADADVMAPSKLFRERLRQIDEATEAEVARLHKTAQEKNAAIPQGNPEDVGAKLRDLIAKGEEEKQKAISAIYNAVDPDGKLHVVAAPARDAAARMVKDFDPAVEMRSALAAPVVEMVANLPEVMPFNKLVRLDQTITKKMAEAKRSGDSGYSDLVALKGHVMDAINNAMDNQHAWQQKAVERGEIAPENTVGAALLRESKEWLADKAGRAISARAGDVGASGPSVVSGPHRGEGEARGQSGVASRDSGVPGNVTPEPNFDQAAADRLKLGKELHAEKAQLYDQGPLGKALETTGFKGQYKASDAAIPSQAFVKGDAGYSTVDTWLRGANTSPQAIGLMQDAAILRLRDSMKDGMLTPQRLDAWKQNYKHALRAIDEVSPGFSSKFDDVSRATEALGIAQKARDAALAEHQAGVAGRFLGASDPSEVTKIVGDMLTAKDGPTKLKDMMNVGGLNTDFVQGMRRAGANYILDQFSNASRSALNDAELSSANFRKFLTKNEGSLKVLYGDEGLANLKRVAEDMERSQVVFNAVQTKGGSDTIPKLVQLVKDNPGVATQYGITGTMLLGSFMQAFAADPKAALIGFGSTAVKMAADKLYANGVDNVRDLYVLGLLDHKVGAAMLQRAVDANGNVNVSALRRITDAVAASTARSLYLNAPEEKRQARATGGKVLDHSSIAAQLIRAADGAHKAQTKTTEPLLAVPDDTVARALEIAGQGL